jgi:hypothetical protein
MVSLDPKEVAEAAVPEAAVPAGRAGAPPAADAAAGLAEALRILEGRTPPRRRRAQQRPRRLARATIPQAGKHRPKAKAIPHGADGEAAAVAALEAGVPPAPLHKIRDTIDGHVVACVLRRSPRIGTPNGP